MTHIQWRLTASHLAVAAFLATGFAAAPFGLGDDLRPQSQAAMAQASGSDSGGSGGDQGGSSGSTGNGNAGATDDTDAAGNGAAATDGPGVAEERATERADGVQIDTAESVYEILGTTREEAEAADTTTSATAQYGQLEAYQTEVERGNLDAAAENLASIAEDPITEEMVTEVNTHLGVETTLTAKQIADVAARKQDEGS